ncbi:MAG TPA: type III pantothenate kinase [Thermodesulfobacteriota bacterium]|nr:type III pantothenate kinase [Thermodesulfobacteriota bacterium]
MLLAIDIGNTNIVLGLYDGGRLAVHWRLATGKERTADEYAVVVLQLLALAGVAPRAVDAAILASVVPPLTPTFVGLCRSRFGVTPLVVGPEVDTGLVIRYANPAEVGADRIVNAVAAHARYRRAAIVVDFGTATTFDYVSAAGEYLGGAIAPGVAISAEALVQRTSRLPRIEIARPAAVVGQTTEAAMQAGIFYGYVGLVDGIVTRMRQEVGGDPVVVATGGLAPLIAPDTRTIQEVDELLTLDGLRIIHARLARPRQA